MQEEKFKRSRAVFLAWGGFDFLYIAIYFANSFRRGNIPYIYDFTETVKNISSHGGGAEGATIIVYWMLQISILISCALSLYMKNEVKILFYMQTPLRIIFLVPSISFLFPVMGYFGVLTTISTTIVVLVSESIKIYSLNFTVLKT